MNWGGWSIFSDALRTGFAALFSGNVDVYRIIAVSLKVSTIATVISLLVGIPIGMYLGTRRSVSRTFALIIANAGMGLPPVIAGLVVSMLLSRRGPLGGYGLLYTQVAMIIAQVVISLPVIAAIVASGVSAIPAQLRLQARSLGASRIQEAWLTLRESRLTVFAAIAAGFGAIISEVGAVQMVGGNLAGETRVMTTAIVQFTRMGRYGEAMALAVVLLSIIVAVNVLLTTAQTRDEKHSQELH
jgi:tungstate transport system permease protein